MKINYNSSPLPSSSNNIIPSSPSFNTEQLDQLSNQLRMLNIDDESINKVLEQLKTIKNEVFDNEDIVKPTGLHNFVLSKFKPPKNTFLDFKSAMQLYKGNQAIIKELTKACKNESQPIRASFVDTLTTIIDQNDVFFQIIINNNTASANVAKIYAHQRANNEIKQEIFQMINQGGGGMNASTSYQDVVNGHTGFNGYYSQQKVNICLKSKHFN